MTSADVIVDATISLYKPTNGTMDSIIEVHKVNEAWESKTVSWDNMPTYDPVVEDYVPCKLVGRYTWNITDVVRGWYTNENEGILFKASDEIENARNGNWKQFYSSDKGSSEQNGPLLTITFINSNGLEDYWSYNSSSAGRAGTGYVNLFTGNLTWVRGDLGFDGNRMPVSISHVYNSNDSHPINLAWDMAGEQIIIKLSPFPTMVFTSGKTATERGITSLLTRTEASPT